MDQTRPRAGLETRCPAFGVYASCPKLFLGRLVGPYAFVYGSCPCRQNQRQMSSASPTTQSSVFPISPAASPSPPLNGMGTPRTCREPLPRGCHEPVAPPTASECAGPPQPVVLTPTLMLLPHSFPAMTISHLASPGSLGLSALPRSDLATPTLRTCGPSAALWPSTSSALASSTFPESSPPPSVTPAQPLATGSLPSPQRVVALAPSRPPLSSASHRSLDSPAASWPFLTTVTVP
ncbi:hypothetical protein DPX16_21188 [Anabarilius grahami]|uniref:Uncharacterized protein n=1 Tax=Anabarilius grahami TaxID=495550 RepID=A0A3N0Z3A1_ANAGA|nr:hypothetical protein DPX16_21188 [Anabarilius grahami]